MKVVFKREEIGSSELELSSGIGVNSFGKNALKFTLHNIKLCAESDTKVDVFFKAFNFATNDRFIRKVITGLSLSEGFSIDLLQSPMLITNEYSLIISKTNSDNVPVNIYVEFDINDDNTFVSSYSELNH